MSLAVVLATRNNCELLGSTLENLCGLEVPCEKWQVLIIDNGSNDETCTVLKRFSGRLPLIALKEPIPGKNRALNPAIPYLSGQLAVFTDDDVIPDRDWLVRLWEAAQRQPEYDIFGGQIRGHWPQQENPMGLSPKLLAPIYTITNPGLGEGPVVPELVWGPNMAVRTAVFEAGHRFDETIGPDGTDHYPMGSETSFVRKLGQCGYRAWHVPSARVQHVIRPFQLDRGWILRRAQRYGRGEYRMLNQGGPCEQLPTLFGYPRWAVRRLAKLMLRQLLSFRWLTPGRFLEADWEYHKFLGYVKEAKKGGGNERH